MNGTPPTSMTSNSPDLTPQWKWQAHSESVRGASHVRAGLPNQDSGYFFQEEGFTVVAVADGHGSPKSFRSDLGSKMAVDAAVWCMTQFIKKLESPPDGLPGIRRMAENHLPIEIVREWIARVDRSLALAPWSEDEKKLVEQSGASAWSAIEDNPRIAYGTTLLLVAVTPRHLFCFQIGDGDILAVAPDGKTVERLIPHDAGLIANETTSLCMKEANKQFRFSFRYLSEQEPPRLIMLSTDGYANSFDTPKAFEQVASDLLGIIVEKGFDAVCKKLPAWLEEASGEGSGDDVTVGVLYRSTPSMNEETG